MVLDTEETQNLYQALSKIEREQYFTWIMEKSHTRSEQGKLVALDISWLGIRDIPSGFLDGLQYLRDLRFDNNPRCNFEDLSLAVPSLTNLRLQYCQLSEFPSHSINSNNALQYLDLSYNPIIRTEPQNYRDLIHLIELDLHHCELQELAPASFQDLSQLRLLNLNFNALEELPPIGFNDLGELQLLTMENNQLRHLDEKAFTGLSRLEELMLPHNELQILPNTVFRDLKSVKTISLIHNQLLEVDRQFTNLSNLTSLNLQMNLIQSIPHHAFEGSTNLIHLSLESNQIEELDPKLFDPLQQLEFFNINNNPLSIESALELPAFSKFDYTSIIYRSDSDSLHELITRYAHNENFITQAIHSGKLNQKSRAFVRLLGYIP